MRALVQNQAAQCDLARALSDARGLTMVNVPSLGDRTQKLFTLGI
jgi:hypothetical protein